MHLLTYNKKKTQIKRECFNFKNKEEQQKFFNLTSETKKFSSCFQNEESFENNSNKFFKTLNDAFHTCFKKIRIKSKSTINSSQFIRNTGRAGFYKSVKIDNE